MFVANSIHSKEIRSNEVRATDIDDKLSELSSFQTIFVPKLSVHTKILRRSYYGLHHLENFAWLTGLKNMFCLQIPDLQ